MARFLPKPLYTIREIVEILNSYEQRRHGAEVWNRKKVRTMLRAFGVNPRSAGERCRGFVTFEQLHAMAPDVVDSMLNLDALEEAQAA